MIKYSKYISAIFVGILLIFNSCKEEEYKLGTLITPTNVDFTFEIVGQDDDNPYGDGSGMVNFSATADDEITFKYIFGDGKDDEIAPAGEVSHVFAKNGVNSYNVTVVAIGTGGISASKTMQLEVFSSFSDDEALEFLTGGDTKTWYWAGDQPGHAGLGPNFVDGVNHTFAAWYNAAPFEKAATCMYDAEFVFTKVNGGMTFQHNNPTGQAFIPGTYAGDLGVDGDVCHGADVVPAINETVNVSFGPSSSIATVDGGYRGTTMTFSDGGFIGWYVGVSDYEIISVTNNLLEVRVAEDETFAWYFTFTTEKPIQ